MEDKKDLVEVLRLDYEAHILNDSHFDSAKMERDPFDSYAIVDGAAYYKWYLKNVGDGFFAPKRTFVARIDSSRDTELSVYFKEPYTLFTYPGTGGGIPTKFIVGIYIY